MTLVALTGFSFVEPSTTVAPFIFVLCVSAVKDGYEDLQRRQADREMNEKEFEVLVIGGGGGDGGGSSAQFVLKRSADILVGDIVRLHDNETVPADVVLLSSGHADAGVCYLETMNLDGETNLKPMRAAGHTIDLFRTAEAAAKQNGACVVAPLPNADLGSFDARMELPGHKDVSLTPKQLLLRGTTVRNTGHAIGTALYCGVDSKIVQNSVDAPFKLSAMERALNTAVVYLFVLNVLMNAMCSVTSGVLYDQPVIRQAWYGAPPLLSSLVSAPLYTCTRPLRLRSGGAPSLVSFFLCCIIAVFFRLSFRLHLNLLRPS
jgi:phospholipid-transporting ATPase